MQTPLRASRPRRGLPRLWLTCLAGILVRQPHLLSPTRRLLHLLAMGCWTSLVILRLRRLRRVQVLVATTSPALVALRLTRTCSAAEARVHCLV